MNASASFHVTELAALHALMRQRPFATVVSHGSQGLAADHLPVLLDADGTTKGVLRLHVAHANPLWREAQASPDCLVVFRGPAAYVSPNWYPTKQLTHKVVPTYNYQVVHARGRMRVIDDAAWLLRLLADLTAAFEAGREPAWQVSDAPEAYIDTLLRNIVGIEIEVLALEGVFKLGQNRSVDDRLGTIAGLRREAAPEPHDVASAMVARMAAVKS